MEKNIILVDENDNIIGYEEKYEAHKKKLLHRAFSIFIFDWNTKKLLLQKRAYSKYHSGGLWTNACCSHPHQGETMEICLNERLHQELGLNTNFHIINPSNRFFLFDGPDVIYYCGKFNYFSDYGEVGENEIDHVFLYSPFNPLKKESNINSLLTINTQEIEKVKWVTIEELFNWMEHRTDDFTTWFRPAFELAYKVLCTQARDADHFMS